MEHLRRVARDACRDLGCTCADPVTRSTVELPGVGTVSSVRIEHDDATCPVKVAAMAAKAAWN